jgi:hypothetical protein
METLYEALEYITSIMKNKPLAINLLFWFSFTILPDSSVQSQRFNLVGDPVVVFNRQHITGSISSRLGVCNASSYSTFDLSTGSLLVQFDYLDYVTNPVCNQSVSPAYFGYIPGVHNNMFGVSVDVRSLITALSVNMKILNFENIVEIDTFRSSFVYNGIIYTSSSYYDPKFPGMSPITCIVAGETQQCTIHIVGILYAIPIFNHRGQNSEVPSPCDCSMTDSSHIDECNLFNFIVGLLFWESVEPDDIFSLVSKYNYNYGSLNTDAYPASFISSYWGQQSSYSSMLNSRSNLEAAFSFCNNSAGISCTLLTFSTFDTTIKDWAVSKYYYQLEYGACNNSVAPPKSVW